VRLVAGERGWASAAALAIELAAAAVSFAAATALDDDRYGCGFALWIVVITMLSPVAWPQFLVCLVPLYVGIAAAWHAKRLPQSVLNVASASHVSALFMGGPLGFLARASAGHVHLSYFLPAEATFVSLAFAYFAAYFAVYFESSSAASSMQPGAKGRAAVSLRASLELGRDL
jgi:hypothetical protein